MFRKNSAQRNYLVSLNCAFKLQWEEFQVGRQRTKFWRRREHDKHRNCSERTWPLSVWDHLPSPRIWGGWASSDSGKMVSIGQGMDSVLSEFLLASWFNGIGRIGAVHIDWMNELAASQIRAVINLVAVSAPSSHLMSMAWERSHFLSVLLKFQPQWFCFLVFQVNWTALYSG